MIDINLKINLFIIISLFLFGYLFYKNKAIEKMTESTNPSAQTIVSNENLMAIKNLGDLAAEMISPDGNTLTLPYDVEIQGDLNVTSTESNKGKITSKNSITTTSNLVAKGGRLYFGDKPVNQWMLTTISDGNCAFFRVPRTATQQWNTGLQIRASVDGTEPQGVSIEGDLDVNGDITADDIDVPTIYKKNDFNNVCISTHGSGPSQRWYVRKTNENSDDKNCKSGGWRHQGFFKAVYTPTT